MGNYTVKADRKGKHTVKYQCVHCQSPLESPLKEAGQVFDCPTCGTKTQTPGIRELEQQRETERRVEQLERQTREEDAKRQAAMAQAAEESRMAKAAKAAARAEARSAAPARQVSLLAFCLTLFAVVVVFFFAAVWPLKTRLREVSAQLAEMRGDANGTANALNGLTATVHRNIGATNENSAGLSSLSELNRQLADTRAGLQRTSDALAALTETVNHNVRVANEDTAALLSLTRTVNRNADALDSLTDTVNHNAEVQNLNNALR